MQTVTTNKANSLRQPKAALHSTKYQLLATLGIRTVRVKRFVSIFVILLLINMQAVSYAYSSSFIEININNSISFHIPRNWTVLSDDKIITLNAIIESALPISTSVRFQANLKDDNGRPITTIQIYRWKSDFYQTDVDAFGELDIVDYNRQMQNQSDKQLNAIGGAISRWHGSKKSQVNGLVVLTSEYSRPSSLAPVGHFRVQVLRIYSGNKSFSFVISYHEENILPLRILVDKVISTLRCAHCM